MNCSMLNKTSSTQASAMVNDTSNSFQGVKITAPSATAVPIHSASSSRGKCCSPKRQMKTFRLNTNRMQHTMLARASASVLGNGAASVFSTMATSSTQHSELNAYQPNTLLDGRCTQAKVKSSISTPEATRFTVNRVR